LNESEGRRRVRGHEERRGVCREFLPVPGRKKGEQRSIERGGLPVEKKKEAGKKGIYKERGGHTCPLQFKKPL